MTDVPNQSLVVIFECLRIGTSRLFDDTVSSEELDLFYYSKVFYSGHNILREETT
jgi:hypothetical protein